jgi:hypothetical protein
VRRRVLNLLTLLSLLLCVAMVVLWVRSYRVGSVVGYYAELGRDGWYRSVSVGSRAGRITLVPLHSKFAQGLARGRFHAWDDAKSVPQAIPGWAGFGYRRIQGREMGWMEFRVPHGFAVALLTAWPVARLARARRRRKSDPGGFPVTAL